MSAFTTLQEAVQAAGGTIRTAGSSKKFGAAVAKALTTPNVKNVFVAISPAGIAQYAKMRESIEGFEKVVALLDATTTDSTKYSNNKTTAKYAQSVRSNVTSKLDGNGWSYEVDRSSADDVVCGFGFRLKK
jgi:hypothetical protein